MDKDKTIKVMRIYLDRYQRRLAALKEMIKPLNKVLGQPLEHKGRGKTNSAK